MYAIMSEKGLSKDWSIDNQNQAIIAALPPILFAIGSIIRALVISEAFYLRSSLHFLISIIIMMIPFAVIACVGLIALLLRLPGWSYTWVGSTIIGLLLFVKVAGEEGFIASDIVGPIVGVLILLIGLALFIIAALRGWPQAGLMSIGLSTLFGLSLYAALANPPIHRYDIAVLTGPLGFLMALLIYIFARRSDWSRIGVLLSLCMINAVLVWTTNEALLQRFPSSGRPSVLLPLIILLTMALLAGPLMALFIQSLHRLVRQV